MNKDTRKNSENRKKTSTNIRLPKVISSKNDPSQQTNESRKQTEQERPKSLEAMMIDIQRRQNEFEHEQISTVDNEQEYSTSEVGEGSRKAFYREFKKVVDASDIIIEVLDARDPLGCRCPQVEESVLTSGKNKRLILLLNKIDLIPRENLDKWLKYLRNEFPTIAFRSSTQNQRDHLGHIRTSLKACDEHVLKSSSKCIGASTLMSLLSNYCRKNDIKTSITVGIVGYPNVGKSSVINSLKRSQACETGSMPGMTKQMQTVKLDKLIKLFDSPGIVMSKETNPANLVLRNCIRIETIENPIPAIELLLHRCTKEQMMLQYDLTDFDDVHDFLLKIAMKMGSLKKGGVPDIHKAAQRVLSDWTHGKLTYFTEPPERTNEIIRTDLVTEMREAFDINTSWKNEVDDLQTAFEFEQNEDENMSASESDTVEVMDEEHENEQTVEKNSDKVHFTVQIMDKGKRSSKQQAAELAAKQYDDDIRRSIDRSNLIRQQEFKKVKKHQKKSEKTMESLGDALDSIVRFTPTSITHDSIDE